MASPSPYTAWNKDDLIARIQSLERVLADSVPASKIPLPHNNAASLSRPAPSESTTKVLKKTRRVKEQRPFDFDAHPRRKIALKFCYSGWEYNGLAFQKEPTPLPMVEAVLLEALSTTRLIDGTKGMEGCGWSRCGRTDKGVSGAGQVVALWVRSAVGLKKMKGEKMEVKQIIVDDARGETCLTSLSGGVAGANLKDIGEAPNPNLEEVVEPELRYVHMLNSVLPASIRILAWSPVADNFDARFSCQFRHYKYFFTPWIPPYGPISHPKSTQSPSANLPLEDTIPVLDIAAMQDAASRLVGEHDFRNFCKIDPSKQIENYKRMISLATISPLDPFSPSPASHASLPGSDQSKSNPQLSTPTPPVPVFNAPAYVFDLMGNGFLWHQVRHIMAILFHVGARAEHPSIVNALLNVGPEHPLPPIPVSSASTTPPTPLVPTKPHYEMADGLPLVLWDCGYSPDDVNWRTDDDSDQIAQSRTSSVSTTTAEAVHLDLRHLSERNMVKMTMQNHFARVAEFFLPLKGLATESDELREQNGHQSGLASHPARIPMGAGSVFQSNRYIPILDRPRGERAEVSNERWRTGAGARKMERKAVAASLIAAEP